MTLGADGTMVDFAAGHLSSEQSHPIVAALDAALGDGRDGVRFHAGVEYRHLVVTPSDWADAECVPPHDLTGKPAIFPTGPAAAKLMALMDASRPVVAEAAAAGRLDRDADLAVGPGHAPDAAAVRGRASASRVGSPPRSTSCAGSACSRTSRCSTSRARAPGFDNDYGAQRDACLESLADRDFFLLHVEATDEAGHQQNAAEKVAALESWDREIIGPLLDALPAFGPFRILLMPDHATPIRLGTHTSDPVPYLLFDSESEVNGPGVHRTGDGRAAGGARARPHGPDGHVRLTSGRWWRRAIPRRTPTERILASVESGACERRLAPRSLRKRR